MADRSSQTSAPATPQVVPPQTDPRPIAPVAGPSRIRRRHIFVMVSFFAFVALPALVVAGYLWLRAADQYASTVAFSVRAEEASTGGLASILGSLNVSSSSTSDTDILYEFIQSQALVAAIDTELDLRALWAKGDPTHDPVFAYHPPGTIEDLVAYWSRMVKITYDSNSGMIELRVTAFTPGDAQTIADAIFRAASDMINELSSVAREDAIGYARDGLDQAVERLKTAREALTQFRNRTQIVDPTVDLQGQAGLLNTLNQQLAEALIELDLLRSTTRENDPRIGQLIRKIEVIEDRIAEERRKLGFGGTQGQADGEADGEAAFATLVGEYERLAVDLEFAQQTYTAALATFDTAQAEALRQSRYLAAHITPTLAERALYPQRGALFGIFVLLATLGWSVMVLIAYSLRDRR